MSYDVVTLGEVLIDFTENGISAQENKLFEANPGGAPCNVLAMLTKLGKKTAFIGKVGDDQFGHLLKETIERVGITSKGLVLDTKCLTTLAFVHTFADGDRDFSFYRVRGADVMLAKDEIDYTLIDESKVFNFGTLSMTDEPARSATIAALKYAKKQKKLISFDPNLREPLWENLTKAKEMIELGLTYCDILKISDNEIRFLTELQDFDEGVAFIQAEYGIPLIFLTMGKEGSRAYYKDLVMEVPGYQVETIETTGAGDTFTGCAINGVLNYGLENLDLDKLEEILDFANAAAALVTTKKGAILSMPTKEEVKALQDTIR